ncbi:iron-sulfur cluster assembly scaffold protein [Sphingomonas sp. LY29]|uniref:iron-sulfur cluster assembly scaffold protein n=1 Tax=Sphingomonas sp. LY29 TaxID=3095341 RepID=UPI002D76E835|nr:iron-sulfur cluster assembly scaffold protein [Sphingomonas sp. LY29]WRP26720.1 iron-sulfur cluster assembly scaffold protein [Sphingomonas sp. LY29]
MSAPLYTREILRLAATIPGVVRFEELADVPDTRSTTCGSRMRVAVALDDDGRVSSVTQAVEACAFGQAAANLMAANATGSAAADIAAALPAIEAWLDGADGEPWPGLMTLDPARSRRGRRGAILLPFRALLSAIEASR